MLIFLFVLIFSSAAVADIGNENTRNVRDLEKIIYSDLIGVMRNELACSDNFSCANSNNKNVDSALADRNSSLFEQTLSLVKEMPITLAQLRGYRALVFALKKMEKEHSTEMLLLAYHFHNWLKQHAQELPSSDYGNSTRGPFQSLFQEIPEMIRNLFRNSYCTIRNLEWDEYLFTKFVSTRNGKRVLWTFTGNVTGEAAEWILEPKLFENTLVFNARNKKQIGSDMSYLCEYKNMVAVGICNGTREEHLHKWIMRPLLFKKGGLVPAFTLQNGEWMEWNDESFLLSTVTQRNQIFKAYKNLSQKEHRGVVVSSLSNSSYWQVDCKPLSFVSDRPTDYRPAVDGIHKNN